MDEKILNIDERLEHLGREAEDKCRGVFYGIEKTAEHNSRKVLSAFIHNKVSESHFKGSTGYGYGDRGRETLDAVMAEITGCEDALMRHNFVSGTHTLTTMLFGVLRPGDVLLSLTGLPYDTIQPVIGITGKNCGSLKEFGVEYQQVDLAPDGQPDYEAVAQAVKDPRVKVAYVQRSRGYSLRPSVNNANMRRLIDTVKQNNPQAIFAVDNCYGIFTQEDEPSSFGADLIAGSLIKNAGGGIARTGGYIAGRRDLIEQCACRLTVPGQGKEVGCTLDELPNMYLGLFLAPNVVCNAMKTAVFTAKLFEMLGFDVSPSWDEPRTDIIQTIKLGSEKAMTAFCRGLQGGAPVDSFVKPEPADMPGYENKVIMAAGSFHLGASIELSADGPLKEPYAVWMQGGLTYFTGKAGVLLAAQAMLDDGVIHL